MQIESCHPHQRITAILIQVAVILFLWYNEKRGDSMTLFEAKKLLNENDFVFKVSEFEDEATYWHHTMLFPYTKNARNCKVLAFFV